MPVGQPEPQLDDPLLPIGELAQLSLQLILQHDEGRRLHRHHGVRVLNEVTQVGFFLADRRLQRHRLLGDPLDLGYPIRLQPHLRGDLVGRRLAAEFLMQLTLDPGQLVDRLHHVHGHPYGAGLIGDRPGDGLPDPPGRIGGELVAAGVVELLDRADEAQVAFLDQVKEHEPPADIPLGDGDHEPQVRLDQLLLGPDPLAGELLQVAASRRQLRTAGEDVLGEQASLDRLGEIHLVFRGKERNPADFPEVDADQVAGGGAAAGLLDPRLHIVDVVLDLRRDVEDLDAFLGQRAHGGVEGFRRQIGTIQGDHDLSHGHRPSFPSPRNEIRELVGRCCPACYYCACHYAEGHPASLRHDRPVREDPTLLRHRYSPAARSSNAFLRFSRPTRSPNILLYPTCSVTGFIRCSRAFTAAISRPAASSPTRARTTSAYLVSGSPAICIGSTASPVTNPWARSFGACSRSRAAQSRGLPAPAVPPHAAISVNIEPWTGALNASAPSASNSGPHSAGLCTASLRASRSTRTTGSCWLRSEE